MTKVYQTVITDPEEVKIMNEGFAAMKAFMRMKGVPEGATLVNKDYAHLFDENGNIKTEEEK